MQAQTEQEAAVRVFTRGCEPAELRAAILLYGGEQPQYARVHPVSIVKGRPEIAANGHALTAEGLLAACTALLGAQRLQFLEPNVLVQQLGLQAWWRPPGRARVLLRCPELGPAKRHDVPLPGLVFASRGAQVFIVAVKGDTRPRQGDAIYVAPLFNHYESGAVCNGSVPFEAGMSPAEIERLYWGSWFTQPNNRVRHTLYRDGFYALWRDLLNAQWQRFPEDTLAPLPGRRSILQFLEQICNDR